MEARIYSTAEAETKKTDAKGDTLAENQRQPLHPVHDNGSQKRKTDPSPSRPETASSTATSHTAAPPSVLERNISTALSSTSTAASGLGAGNIYRPYANAHAASNGSRAMAAAAPVAPRRDREQSPMKKVIKQLGSLDVKGANGSTPPKSAIPRAAGRPGTGIGSTVASLGSGTAAASNPSTAGPAALGGGGVTSDAASVASTASAPSSARGSVRDDGSVAEGGKKALEDEEALKTMHRNVAAAIASAGATPVLAGDAAGELPLPNVWVSRWVDYSKKYGLGYKLSNAQYGVFFNDATKILLKPDGNNLEYIQRQRDESGAKFDTRSDAKMSDHSKDLAKKVTLMQHFRNYLDDPNRHPAGDDSRSTASDVGKATDEGVSVYVRKWMRTRHSVIFRLSNNSLQVSFLDDTEVLLWANRRWVTIKSKDGPRRTLDLKDAATMPDAAKRLKYVHDILAQLVTA